MTHEYVSIKHYCLQLSFHKIELCTSGFDRSFMTNSHLQFYIPWAASNCKVVVWVEISIRAMRIERSADGGNAIRLIRDNCETFIHKRRMWLGVDERHVPIYHSALYRILKLYYVTHIRLNSHFDGNSTTIWIGLPILIITTTICIKFLYGPCHIWNRLKVE